MKHNTLIIGGGVSGLSAALVLLRRGHAVTMLERGEVGRESSWAGGGILSPLLPWDYGEAVSALALRSMRAYPGWVTEVEARSGLVAQYWRCGMRVFDTDAPERAFMWCATHGLPLQRRDDSLWLPDIAQVRNPRLVAALRAAVLNAGGVIREHAAATGVLTHGGQVAAVRTETESLPAEHVVLAAGAWSGLGLAGLAPPPNIRPIRGQMLLFKLAPGALDAILYRRGLYIIPRRDGHVLVGSTLEDAWFDKSTDAATAGRLHREAAELLPALAGAEPLQHWAGLRPGAPANIPVIDRHPDFGNVYVNTGHYRYGVTMAPAAAELLADLIDGRPPALDPAPYRWQAAFARRWTETL
ncbi:MAG: NAD(P)/FAD-dependent oxidoreductase [Gammaproteobacteria bacterium]